MAIDVAHYRYVPVARQQKQQPTGYAVSVSHNLQQGFQGQGKMQVAAECFPLVHAVPLQAGARCNALEVSCHMKSAYKLSPKARILFDPEKCFSRLTHRHSRMSKLAYCHTHMLMLAHGQTCTPRRSLAVTHTSSHAHRHTHMMTPAHHRSHILMSAHRHTHMITPAHHRSHIFMSAHLHAHIVMLTAVMYTS